MGKTTSSADATLLWRADGPLFYCLLSKSNIYFGPQRGGKAKEVDMGLNKQTVNSFKVPLGAIKWAVAQPRN